MEDRNGAISSARGACVNRKPSISKERTGSKSAYLKRDSSEKKVKFEDHESEIHESFIEKKEDH